MQISVNYQMKFLRLFVFIIIPFSLAEAQPVVKPWGNISGMRVNGELMWFETSIRAVDSGWTGFTSTEKYNWEGNQTFTVNGKVHTMSHELLQLPIRFTNKITDLDQGSVKTEISLEQSAERNLEGTYFCFEAEGKEFQNQNIKILNGGKTVLNQRLKRTGQNNVVAAGTGNEVIIISGSRTYRITSDAAVEIMVRNDYMSSPHYLNDPWPSRKIIASDPVMKQADYQIYFALIPGSSHAGIKKEGVFTITASGRTENAPAVVTTDPSRPGRKFEGIGGNFRLQFPDKDYAVIKYCLDSLDVKWGRSAFYWDEWQSAENMDPVKNAIAGKLSDKFYRQMELTRELARKGQKIIFSIWAPPEWAIDRGIKVSKGVVLNNDKIERISRSIADFLWYAKTVYGIDAELFSFNEPDYGVEVRLSESNHAFQYRKIGLHLAERGFKTRILIGDTGAGTESANILMAETEKDIELHRYAGAIAFHTYHGCTDTDLKAWAGSAVRTNLPIMVAEGGTNSAAHRYPLVFLEPWFQLEEINTYIRICNQVQPVTIMEWQLTSDYSVLTGMGMYGDNGPLRPTQRFWNLKQLSISSAGSFSIPSSCSSDKISSAAFFDPLNGTYSVHLVNNGASRMLTVENIPADVKALNIYKTDSMQGMKHSGLAEVTDGKASFEISPECYVTLTNRKL